jgi:RNA polymerase sigma-70 factor (ECF subfamily)
VAQSRLPSDSIVQEIVQETFINCLQTINLFKGQSSLLTWMQSVLRHEIADYYRKLYAKRIIRTTPLADLLLEVDTRDAAGTAEAVTAVLHQMLGKNRELLLRKYVDQLSVKEIAKQLGASNKAVESDLFRARQEFKALWLALK